MCRWQPHENVTRVQGSLPSSPVTGTVCQKLCLANGLGGPRGHQIVPWLKHQIAARECKPRRTKVACPPKLGHVQVEQPECYPLLACVHRPPICVECKFGSSTSPNQACSCVYNRSVERCLFVCTKVQHHMSEAYGVQAGVTSFVRPLWVLLGSSSPQKLPFPAMTAKVLVVGSAKVELSRTMLKGRKRELTAGE